MKSFSLFVIFTLLAFAACEDERINFPTVTSDPGAIMLTSAEPDGSVLLSAEDQGPLNIEWKVTSKPEWLHVIGEFGGVQGTIFFSAITENMLAGTYTGSVEVATTTNRLTIPVTLVVAESVSMQFNPDELFLDEDDNTIHATLTNSSNLSAAWQLTSSAAFITAEPASGTLDPGQSVQVTVTATRTELARNIFYEQLSLQAEGSELATLPVTVSNLLLVSGQVIDAEYSRETENLVLVTNDKKLFKINPATNTITSITLPKVPIAVSVGQDGTNAVVGFETSITRVDLTNMQVKETYPIPDILRLYDVVLAPNNFAYVFPGFSGWDRIRCINLTTGEQSLHTGPEIRGSTKAKLHPSGDYVYGNYNFISPTDAQKYDIRGGQAVYLYDSPYHGEYYFDSEIWLSDDGLRMYAVAGSMFQLSTTQADDMLFTGNLPIGFRTAIRYLDHTSSSNRIAAAQFDIVSGHPLNSIAIWTATTMDRLPDKQLTDFGLSAESECYFVFFSGYGNKLVMVYKLAFDDPRWGVLITNTN